jgi:hypothetical protein
MNTNGIVKQGRHAPWLEAVDVVEDEDGDSTKEWQARTYSAANPRFIAELRCSVPYGSDVIHHL